MPHIEIGAGVTPGAYEVTLQKVSDLKTIFVQGEEVDIYEWTFVTDDGTEIRDSTSTATSPRSKMHGWITALQSGIAPEAGDNIDTDTLIGHRAIATITLNDRGWPKISSLGAIPVATQQRRFAKTTGSPVAEPAQSAQSAQPADLPQTLPQGGPRRLPRPEPKADLPF